MKVGTMISFKLLFGAFVLLILPAVVLSQSREKAPEKIDITSYDIFVQEFAKPLTRIDEKRTKSIYTKAYVVKLKGNFLEHLSDAPNIFIGDYLITEYGGTEDGIYFKIYDEKLLNKLEGQPFGYGFQNQKIKTFDLNFLPGSLKPFKSYELMLRRAVPPKEAVKAPEKIDITSYDIFVWDFKKPFVKIDEKGTKQSYTKAYVVKVKGNFLEHLSDAPNIFIGDYKVPEYGGTKDGIYFKIFDERLLERLEGRPFGYGFQNQKIKTLDIRFRPSTLKPFKKVDKK